MSDCAFTVALFSTRIVTTISWPAKLKNKQIPKRFKIIQIFLDRTISWQSETEEIEMKITNLAIWRAVFPLRVAESTNAPKFKRSYVKYDMIFLCPYVPMKYLFELVHEQHRYDLLWKPSAKHLDHWNLRCLCQCHFERIQVPRTNGFCAVEPLKTWFKFPALAARRNEAWCSVDFDGRCWWTPFCWAVPFCISARPCWSGSSWSDVLVAEASIISMLSE